MFFTSLEYVPFLTLAVCAYQFVPRAWRCVFLLLCSYYFYAEWNAGDLPVLAGVTAGAYVSGRAAGSSLGGAARRAAAAAGIVFILAALCFYKYYGPSFAAIETPLGISYYSFSAIGYIVDVYKKRSPACASVPRLALYIAFFPLLVCGPIERAGHLIPQLEEARPLDLDNLSVGARRILWGFVKKLVLAQRLWEFARPIVDAPDRYDWASAATAAVCMLVYLYADFSAYTDIARGSARLFGVELLENFRRPFLAATLVEFWQRWHMSLMTWIGDYVYSPIAAGKVTHARIWRNNLIAMGLVGLWHGASWKYIIWGLSNGAIVSVYHSLRLKAALARARRAAPSRAARAAGWMLTMIISTILITMFFAPDLGGGLRQIAALSPIGGLGADLAAAPGVGAAWAALAAMFLLHAAPAIVEPAKLWIRIGMIGRALWFAGLVGAIAQFAARTSNPFVYYQF